MVEVQIVRQQRANGGPGGLQALRRRFSMAVSDRSLKISVLSPSPSSGAALCISRSRINSVRVRGRLLRVVVDNGDALTVRLRNKEEALRAAETMMETWDVDPLVEDSEVPAPETEEEAGCGVEELVKHYVNDPNFRQLIHEIHEHVDSALATDEFSYKASV
ncbi:hypothetical protein PHYPSEUDO_011576 [Phytophthora pseudosyringae]|uniref:Uncharacterized protein n=1 Tax=Phytophthora pseudosyringae TaxID=221518 RepID=A0A8T1WB71_9STRA|nr:hypothetical protein PHYPSEUDO_011576 [Phytophthora pseudosyringae]